MIALLKIHALVRTARVLCASVPRRRKSASRAGAVLAASWMSRSYGATLGTRLIGGRGKNERNAKSLWSGLILQTRGKLHHP
jgi:hypothetical protein